MSCGPIFIGGEGRSGTTLLALILDSHPAISCGPELHFRGPENLGPLILRCMPLHRQLGERKPADLEPAHRHGVNFIRRCVRMGVPEEVLEEAVRKHQNMYADDIGGFERRCALMEELCAYVRDQKGAERWGIKIMRDLRIANRYCAVWPDARFVHIVRDGRDVAASQMMEHGSWGYADITVAATSWRDLLWKAEQLSLECDVYTLRYEDLVRQPRNTIRPLLDWLGVKWSEQVLKHADAKHFLFERPYGHPSLQSVSGPLNDGAIGRYHANFSRSQIEEFESIAGDMLIKYHYDVSRTLEN